MLTMSPSQGAGDGRFDLLGSLVMQIYSFIDLDFAPPADHLVYDNVTACMRPLSELFEKRDGRWFVTDECLPGMAEVKAISFIADRITFETAPLAPEEVREGLAEYDAPFTFDDVERVFKHQSSRRTVVRYSPPKRPKMSHDGQELELGPRILMHLPVPKAEDIRNDLALLVEVIEQKFAFISDEDTGEVVAPGADQKPKLQLDFQLKLALEQKPILTLSQELGVSGTLELQQNLGQLLAFGNRMETLSQAEAVHYVRLLAEAQGTQVAANRLVFALAGKVKQAKPNLSWKEARAIARKKLIQVAQNG